jgi:hypothetical protein
MRRISCHQHEANLKSVALDVDLVEQIQHVLADIGYDRHDRQADACRDQGVFDRRGSAGVFLE